MELDEMWTFVGRKRRKVWRWLAVERHTHHIVAWVLGTPGTATARRLWQALPAAYRTGTWYYTNEWTTYRRVLPPAAHRPSAKGSGRTSIVEALSCSLRQRCACSFSCFLAMHRIRLQLCIDDHNVRCTLN
ncbi:IS1 family transposase [Hymenobacter guriensis]|uniref:IS1 family transposase n=1 Tax=Hymenobacter guriensis TaxID=2793065 RepID=A0ABS0L5V4_9BACT|nr:IS1 family transposase [Hymenobacter guriensis]MBG8555498.1 IS1 family transposase [Hymenobacter guriensis]